MNIQLNPGDVLAINIPTVINSPLGETATDVLYHFAYEDLIEALKKKQKTGGKSKRSKTKGTLLSRRIALLVRSLHTGMWSTGAIIKRTDKATDLFDMIEAASDEDLSGLTDNAYEAVRSLRQIRALEPLFGGQIDRTIDRLGRLR